MKCSITNISEIFSKGSLQGGCDELDCGYVESRLVADSEISILLTDSRSLSFPANTLFFAIPTKGNDGHRYVKPLYERGVRNFVVNAIPADIDSMGDANFLVVGDTTKALQKLAYYHRADIDAQIVAITGSRGKTTLKEWIYYLLNEDYRIMRSPRSYNSQIGVPLSLWELESDAQVAIIEAGISKSGEMRALNNIIKPNMVVLTNVREEYFDDFDTIEDKASEKVLLAEGSEVVIYNADCESLKSVADGGDSACKWIGWSRTDSSASLYVSVSYSEDNSYVDIDYKYYDGRSGRFRLPFSIDYEIENAVAALAVVLEFGLSAELISERMSQLLPVGTRLDVTEGVNDCSLIYDSYTCDFASLWQAVDFMGRRVTKDKSMTLILSDLYHEGKGGEPVYAMVAELCRMAGISRFIGIGEALMCSAHLFDESSKFFPSTDKFMQSVSTSDFSNELILIKGAPQFEFRRIQENLEARTHETVLEVNLDSVVKNFNYFRQQIAKGTGIVAMVKASGYGAGSYEIAKTLQDCGAAYLAVAVLDEGIDLRRAGISMPIMVMNPKVVNYKSMFAYHLEPEIYNMDMLRDVIHEAEKNGVREYPVHIKLDTGMHRMGFIEEELEEVMHLLNSQDYVVAASVFSHLATADCIDMDDYTQKQLQLFDRLTGYMIDHYPRPIKRHVLNSAGILRFSDYHYDMVRLGIGLYGANTLPAEVEKPLAVVSTLRTVIIAVREWEAGEAVGYGRRGMLHRRSKIATIPIGYADGMNRQFGNGRSRLYVNGKYVPTVGNICMDACMIDVTDVDCKVGDTVEIFGEHVTVNELAELLGTIPYEVLTSVSPRVKRIYYRE